MLDATRSLCTLLLYVERSDILINSIPNCLRHIMSHLLWCLPGQLPRQMAGQRPGTIYLRNTRALSQALCRHNMHYTEGCLIEIFSKKQAALFLLKTHEERKVTQTSLNGIVKDFHGLWQDSMENLKVCLK